MTNNNKTFLKNILTTASVMAITLAASDAMAAAAIRDVTAGGNQPLDTTTAGLDRAVNNDALKLTQDNTVLQVVTAAVATGIQRIDGIDVNGKDGATIEVGAQPFSLGSVIDGAAAAGGALNPKKLNVSFTAVNNGVTLTGAGIAGIGINDYSALGDIDFLAVNKAITITMADGNEAVISSNIGSSTNDNVGVILIKTNTIFTGNIGADHALNKIVVFEGKAATFTGATVHAQDIIIGVAAGAASGNSTITFGAATAAGTTVTSANGIVGQGANNTIKIKDKAIFNTNVGANIASIEIQDDSVLTINAGKAINAGAIIKAAVDNKGQLVLNGQNTNAQIAEAGTALEKVTFAGLFDAAGAAVALGHEVHATTIDLTDGSKLIINDNIKAENVTASAGGVSELVMNGDDAVINFNVGADGQSLKVNLTENVDRILTLGDVAGAKVIYGNILNDNADKLLVKTGVTRMKVVGDLGTNGAALRGVTIDADHALLVQGNIYAPVTLTNLDSELVTLGTFKVDSELKTGKVTVGDGVTDTITTFGKAVGAAPGAGALAAFEIKAKATAVLTEDSEVDVTLTAANSVLRFTIDDKTLTGHIAGDAANKGSVEVAGNWTINGDVTDIGKVTFTAADKTLTIAADKNLATKIVGFKAAGVAHDAATAGTVIFKGATASRDLELGTDAEMLRKVEFQGDADVKNIYATDIELAATKTATALNFAGKLNLVAADSIFTLKDDGSASVITGLGEFITKGNATLRGNIGEKEIPNPLGLGGPVDGSLTKFDMQGAAGKVITTSMAEIYANEITQGAATLILTENLKMTGAYTGNNSTIELGQKTLTFDGNVTFNGNIVINTTVVGINAGDYGVLNLGAGVLDLAAANSITLNIDTNPAAADVIVHNTQIAFINANAVQQNRLAQFVLAPGKAIDINSAYWKNDTGTPGVLRFDGAARDNAKAAAAKVLADKAVADAAAKVLADKAIADAAANQVKAPDAKDTPKDSAAKIAAVKDLFTQAFAKHKDVAISGDMSPKEMAEAHTTSSDVVNHPDVQAFAKDHGVTSHSRFVHMLQNTPSDDAALTPDSLLAIATKAADATAVAEKREGSQHKNVAAASHGAAAVITHAITQVAARTTSLAIPAMHMAPTPTVAPTAAPAAVSAPNVASPKVNIGGTSSELEASSGAGVAAGSGAYDKFGLWAQINGGVATQKAEKGVSGFKSNMVGSMIGVDTMVNDQVLIGFAVANVINNIKQKDIQKGDKTRSSSWVASVYGNYQLENNWFLRGAAAYTRTAVNNTDLRDIALNKKGAVKGKYNINSFGGELTIGKALNLPNNLILVPTLGARFAHTGKISYQETGNTGLNNKVSQGAMNSMQAVAGLQLMKMFDMNGLTITPEAHANVQYGLGVKSPKGKYTSQLDGTPVNYTGNKASRLSSTIGVGITADSDRIEYGIAYDANLAKGYVGHQGTLKLKVKF